MKYDLVQKIREIILSAQTPGHAIVDVAKSTGVDVGYDRQVPIDIMDHLPSIEEISVANFRLAIVTTIVRIFYPDFTDINKVNYLRSMYARFYEEGSLSLADMQTYDTMISLLDPKTKDRIPPLSEEQVEKWALGVPSRFAQACDTAGFS
jgi:hypothetical protein